MVAWRDFITLATDLFIQPGYALCHHMEQQENEVQSFRFRQKFGGKDGIFVEKLKDIEIIKNLSKLIRCKTKFLLYCLLHNLKFKLWSSESI